MAAAADGGAGSVAADPIHSFVIDDLCAATFTPYAADGAVDCSLVDVHCADLAEHNVRWAFINGTTGDSMSLSVKERKALAEAWVAAGTKYGVKIVNHIGAASIEDSKELAAHAQECGCVAISAMPCFFFKSNDAKVVASWLRDIGAAAPKMPLYYYHFNVITQVFVDPLQLIIACEEVGAVTFRGFKFTDFNLWHYSNCVAYKGGKYDCVYGRDEAMLGGLATGAKASIGNGFNFMAGCYQRLRKAFFSGDMAAAKAEQERINSVVNIMNAPRYGGNLLSTSRLIYEWKNGGKVKLGPVRTPHVPLTEAQQASLKAELEAIRFYEWCD